MDQRELEVTLADLNTEYVAQVGAQVREVLLAGLPCALEYQPGNMTRYELVFTPASRLATFGGRALPSGFGDSRNDAVVVTYLKDSPSGVSWAVNLLGREGKWLAPWYVQEKLPGVTSGDAVALIALFAEIADDQRVLHGEPVSA